MRSLYNALCSAFFRWEVRRMKWINLATPERRP